MGNWWPFFGLPRRAAWRFPGRCLPNLLIVSIPARSIPKTGTAATPPLPQRLWSTPCVPLWPALSKTPACERGASGRLKPSIAAKNSRFLTALCIALKRTSTEPAALPPTTESRLLFRARNPGQRGRFETSRHSLLPLFQNAAKEARQMCAGGQDRAEASRSPRRFKAISAAKGRSVLCLTEPGNGTLY